MSVIITIFMLLTVFPIYFTFLPKMAWHVIYIGVPLLYLLINLDIIQKKLLRIEFFKILLIIFSIFTISFVYSLVRIIFSTEGITYLNNYVLMLSGIVKFLAILTFIDKNRDTEDTLLENFIKYYVFAVCIYVACSVLFLFLPDLKFLWQGFIHTESLNERFLDNINSAGLYVTRFGLQGWSGFSASVFCSVGIWLNLIMLNNFKSSIFYFFSLCILLLGNSFYARSGLIISIIMITLVFLHEYRKIISIKSISCVCFLGTISFIILFIFSDQFYFLDVWYAWLFSPFEAFMEGLSHGTFSLGSSGDVLINKMYYIPQNDMTILLGDGLYTYNGGYYGSTDAGIMRNILFGGVVGTVFYYGIYFYIIDSMRRIVVQISKIKFFMFLLVMMVIFFEIKGNPVHLYIGIIVSFISAEIIDERNRNVYMHGRIGRTNKRSTT